MFKSFRDNRGKFSGQPGQTGPYFRGKPGQTGANRGKPGQTGANRGKPGQTGANRGKPGQTGAYFRGIFPGHISGANRKSSQGLVYHIL